MAEIPTSDAPATDTGTSQTTTEAADNTSLMGKDSSTGNSEGETSPSSGEHTAEKTAEGEANGEKEAEDKPKAPEKYEFTPPDGMEIDKEALSSYEALTREHGLSQEQFDAITKHGLEFFQNRLTGLAEQHASIQQGWRDTALKDKTLSDGESLKPEVMQNVAHVFSQFGGEKDALRKALVETGAGNHPAVIHAFNAIGKALGAAQTPDRGKPASELKDNSYEAIARRRYGSN
ncbi:hypothetical protein [Bombella favorum]|uniref:Peptidase n=1 Tax=Bombella favorum TaxID=2039164 RepID=A0ABR5ZLA4_9PROT|nr:hypothetical protein [Bombella favorum]MBA5725025.1 hypothetical protein [Bombella favorum]